MILIPANGRDYKSKSALLEDWKANKDFQTADIMSGYGRATNREELEDLGLDRGIQFRYAKLAKTFYLD